MYTACAKKELLFVFYFWLERTDAFAYRFSIILEWISSCLHTLKSKDFTFLHQPGIIRRSISCDHCLHTRMTEHKFQFFFFGEKKSFYLFFDPKLLWTLCCPKQWTRRENFYQQNILLFLTCKKGAKYSLYLWFQVCRRLIIKRRSVDARVLWLLQTRQSLGAKNGK